MLKTTTKWPLWVTVMYNIRPGVWKPLLMTRLFIQFAKLLGSFFGTSWMLTGCYGNQLFLPWCSVWKGNTSTYIFFSYTRSLFSSSSSWNKLCHFMQKKLTSSCFAWVYPQLGRVYLYHSSTDRVLWPVCILYLPSSILKSQPVFGQHSCSNSYSLCFLGLGFL